MGHSETKHSDSTSASSRSGERGYETLYEFEQLVEDVRGHALTLNLLGSYLRDAHGGDIRRRDLVKLEDADAEEQGGHAFRVLDAYVKSFEEDGQIEQKATKGTKKTNAESSSSALGTGASQSDFVASVAFCSSSASRSSRGQQAVALLSLMGLFDRPASADYLQVLWSGEPLVGLTEPLVGLSDVQRNLALKRLEDARLLTVNRNGGGALVSLDTHPLIREYFAVRVRSSGFSRAGRTGATEDGDTNREPPKGSTTSEARRAAQRRLYEHLCETTPDKPNATLEDLQRSIKPSLTAATRACRKMFA